VSDLFGVSGWAMLESIAQGITDVEVLAGQARGSLRKKVAQLKEALAGRLDPVYRLLLRQHMDQVRLLRRQVVRTQPGAGRGDEGTHRCLAPV